MERANRPAFRRVKDMAIIADRAPTCGNQGRSLFSRHDCNNTFYSSSSPTGGAHLIRNVIVCCPLGYKDCWSGTESV